MFLSPINGLSTRNNPTAAINISCLRHAKPFGLLPRLAAHRASRFVPFNANAGDAMPG